MEAVERGRPRAAASNDPAAAARRAAAAAPVVRVAVLVPCFNDAVAIGAVVRERRAAADDGAS